MGDFPKRQLLINYLLDICTLNQKEEVEYWLDKEPGNISLLQKVAKEIAVEEALSDREKEELKTGLIHSIQYKKNRTKVHDQSVKGLPEVTAPSLDFVRGGRWIKVAALVLVIITAGAMGFYYKSSFSTEKPAKLITRTLSKGQAATLRFGEGTVVQLNAASSLKYPEHFARNKREVYLQGEAFFKVSHNENRPFIVHAGNTITRVWGTAFNINTYHEEGKNVQVAVAEGKVSVSRTMSEKNLDQGKTDNVFLTKNQWVNYAPGNLMEKGQGDISDLIAWKDRRLVFSDKSLKKIAQRLERWYNIEVAFDDSSLTSRRMSASFYKEPVTQVLKVISLSLGLTYKKEGRKITFFNPAQS